MKSIYVITLKQTENTHIKPCIGIWNAYNKFIDAEKALMNYLKIHNEKYWGDCSGTIISEYYTDKSIWQIQKLDVK